MNNRQMCPYSKRDRVAATGHFLNGCRDGKECSYFDATQRNTCDVCKLPGYKGICPVESARMDNKTTPSTPSTPSTLTIHPLIKGVIRDAIIKALKAKPVKINTEGAKWEGYQMDNEIWMQDEAIEHILGEYSWWK